MKILVIGASGMLANPVIRKLDEAGFALRLFSRTVNPSMFVNDYEILQGDLYNPEDLDRAIQGCDALHISISGTDEARATELILDAAKKHRIRRISMVSGCTVAEENRWFDFVDKKYRAEQMIMNSGIPYYIFRPTWFFESLAMFVRKGKATLFGNPTGKYRWLAADDFGSMVARAYLQEGKENGIYYIYGPERHGMKEMLESYCREFYPGIEKVSQVPIPVLKTVAFLTRNKPLKFACALFSYFEKVREPEVPEEELEKLGLARMDFQAWIASKKQQI